jgi:formylglycine-generating enzyme required for sulfatase activity
MRSSMVATTLLLIMGMFFFQTGYSSAQQPNKESFTNSIGIKLLPISKGKFLMGSPETEMEQYFGETQHEVTISQNFYMGSTEVTQSQYQNVMGNNPSFFKGDELPVENVNWEETIEFCKLLSEMPEEKKAGRKYRLPTEAEWEYACRAGTTTPFHFGSQLNGMQANCDGTKPYGTEAEGPHLEKTTAVGKYPANAWGLYDMHGNVGEWCSDWYGRYPAGSVTDPIGPASGKFRVYRGGGFNGYLGYCRSAYRGRTSPSNSDRNYSEFGFRLVLIQMKELTERQDPKKITNSIGIKLVRIPKGKFLMGSPETEKGRSNDEIQREVTISRNFYMGSTEVTQAQWFAVMEFNPSKFKGDQLPVETVSWEESIDFCRRLSEMPEEKKAGRKYRLPTEAEWEYACRAGTTTTFHFGSQLNGRQANCYGNMPYGTPIKGPYLDKTSVVGKYPANAWGLHDMHGNVSEWCSDWYRDYPTGSVTDPKGPEVGSHHVNRGGCWNSSADFCRSGLRRVSVPSFSFDGLGFRVALSTSEIPK